MTEQFDPERVIQAALGEQQAGRLEEAKALYEGLLEERPDYPDALHLLGVISLQTGDPAGGIDYMRRASALVPDDVQIGLNLAGALKSLGRSDEAVGCLRALAGVVSGSPSVHLALADILDAQQNHGAAELHYRRALELSPDDAAALTGLGRVLRLSGREKEAEAAWRRVLKINPEQVGAMVNLALLIMSRGRNNEAQAYLEKALNLAPGHAKTWFQYGNVMLNQNRPDLADEAFAKATTLDPDDYDAHVHLGFARLLMGDFGRGFAEYEWRLGSPALRERDVTGPRWDGSFLDGRTILVHAEQGMGDALQFIRYAPKVARLGGRIILKCHQTMKRLFQGAPGVDDVTTSIPPPDAYDCHVPLMSLAHLFGTTPETIPAEVPYLHPDDGLRRSWAERLGDGPNVGLVWRGNPENKRDNVRSCPLERFSPILETDGARFFSLQKEFPEDEKPLPASLTDLGPELNDFADTAACVANLDLVIAVDTAIVHLAGALGRPVWALLSSSPEWRWMLDRDDSPWYPTARLFRQTGWGDWEGVVARVCGELEKFLANEHR